MRRIVSVMILALLLVGAFMLAFNVGLVHAQAETIYINSDGSVSPFNAPISSVDNVTYTFTGNMSYPAYNGIVVERSNIVIDGNGYNVQGDQSGNGLSLADISNVTIENTNIYGFYDGIHLDSSNSNIISGNSATANDYGIYLNSSSNNIVSGNNVTANSYEGIILVSSSNSNAVIWNNATANGDDGIVLDFSLSNTVSGNNATANNHDGIHLASSSNNTLSSNNVTANSYHGFYLTGSSNNTVMGNNATANSYFGIWLDSSSNNNIVSGNNATANSDDGISLMASANNTVTGNTATSNSAVAIGIWLDSSSNNTVSSNNATSNAHAGIGLDYSAYNTISGNNITANGEGIYLQSSSNNTLYHNDFVGNGVQALVDSVSGNAWDDGYPSGGNYWSNYTGTDFYNGPYQNVAGSDGIGDVPYVINVNNTDDYPLMGGFSTFSVAEGVEVHVISNSTVSDFKFNGTAILFNVSGANGTTGFCNVCVPTSLLNGTLSVFVNGTQVQYSLLPISNSSVSYLYFTYGHSTEPVAIMPEFPSSLILAMFMLATLSAMVVHKKKHSRA
jgi:parallel beta-helix repeat protein